MMATRKMIDMTNRATLSWAQHSALSAAQGGDPLDWVRPNTIDSLLRRGLIRGLDTRRHYGHTWEWRTTPEGDGTLVALGPVRAREVI
jgi:hypothetical protein